MTGSRTLRAVVGAALLASAGACSNSSPLDPTITQLTQNTTRVIKLSGDIDFGVVPVGTTVTRTFTISNTGTGPLTVNGISANGAAAAAYDTTFAGATIAAGSSETVTLSFTPTLPLAYQVTFTVVGSQTSGTNTFNVTGTGSVEHIPLFTKSGTGNASFDIPSHVLIVRITGHYDNSTNLSNFLVFWNSAVAVNEVLRNGDYDNNVLLPGGGHIDIVQSPSAAWTFTEVR